MQEIIQFYRDCWLAGYTIEDMRNHVSRQKFDQSVKDCVLAEISRIDGLIQVAKRSLH